MVRVAIVLALSTSIACAQQSPIEQALIAKLNLETSAGLQCSAALITALARIAELEKQLALSKEQPK